MNEPFPHRSDRIDLRRAAVVLAALVGAGAAGAVATSWLGTSAGEPAAPAGEPVPAIEALTAELDAERRARQQLAGEVEQLRQEVFELGLLARLEEALPEGGGASAVAEARPGAPAGGSAAAATGRPGSSGAPAGAPELRPWFDEEALAALGLGDSEIEALRKRWSEHQLEKMSLSDRASREGWRQKLRFRKESRALDAALVAELGVDRYDLMLFATGQPNRVVVLDVIDGSAAGAAGLQSGDRITGYAGTPVFRRTELIDEIAAGEPGERVRVQVERDGRMLTFDVPRGPLGIRLRAMRVSPSEG
ncbi:MAG: PDZ domain-containing protein [Myxococcota bacterium]